MGFVQLDDLKTQEQVERARPAACSSFHETSPGNRQAWIAVSGAPAGKEEFKEFMRRVRKAVGGNDKSASHATRLAGTPELENEILPNPPTVTILDAHPGRVVTPAQLEALELCSARASSSLARDCFSPPPCSRIACPRTAMAGLSALPDRCAAFGFG